jgi:hypothetical protein
MFSSVQPRQDRLQLVKEGQVTYGPRIRQYKGREKRKAMKKVSIVWLSALLFLLATGIAAQQPDSQDCKDHPLFPTRMPEYRIEACKVEDFGVYEFYATKGPKTPIEGKFTLVCRSGPDAR